MSIDLICYRLQLKHSNSLFCINFKAIVTFYRNSPTFKSFEEKVEGVSSSIMVRYWTCL